MQTRFTEDELVTALDRLLGDSDLRDRLARTGAEIRARDGDPWLDEILAVRRSISGACSPASAMVDPGARSPPRLGVVVLAPARSRFTHRTRALNFERPNHATSDAPPFVQNKTERGARAGVATVAGALTRCRAAREVPPS